MLIEDVVVLALLLVFVGVVVAIRLKARAQRANEATSSKPRSTGAARGSHVRSGRQRATSAG